MRKLTRVFLASILTFTSTLAVAQPPLPIIGYLPGANTGDQLGTSLAGPGDVNGDGFADLLAAELGTKRVKLFYGNFGTSIEPNPDMIWNGYRNVRTIGDINGDGFPEVVMGTDSAHQLRIFWGGTLLDTLPDFVLDFYDTTCIGGKTIADISAGDLNGDGFGDLVVSTIFTCGGPIFELGRAQIFCGGALLDTFPDWTRTVPTQITPRRHSFGAQAKILAKLNGDSFADLVISQTGNQPDGTTGCLHIFLGGNPMDTLEDQIVGAPAPAGDNMGSWGNRIILLNDLNGDGQTDFWVGGGGTLLRLYYGTFPIDSTPSAIFDQGGDRPAPGGDYNKDGFTDLILGQPRASFLAGSVYIYLGSSDMNGVFDIAIHDFQLPTVAEVFGLAVTNTGDMNGDGVDDFAASAKQDVDPFDEGEIFIFSGDSAITTGVEDTKDNLPRFFTLSQNYPNPFNSSTAISYTLFRRSPIRLEIFNIAGEKVKVLLDQEQMAGSHKIFWDGTDILGKTLPSGVYLYKLKAGDIAETRKMVFL